MEEMYSETFLEAKLPFQRLVLRIVMIAAAVLALFIGISSIFLAGRFLVFTIAIIIAGVSFYFAPSSHLAYEYIFVDGQIDFDRILGGAKRKTMKRSDLAEIEIVAPENSHRLDPYQNLPLVDYSSGYSGDRHFIAVSVGEDKKERIRFTPDEKMLSMMQYKAPSKVVTD